MSNYKLSDRGFKQYEPVRTAYGHDVTVYESSAASSPHLWLRIEESDESHRMGMHEEAGNMGAHLTLEQAAEIRDQLDAAIKNHYQSDGEPWEPDPLREALELIDVRGCENCTHGRCFDKGSGRTRGALYTADAWCDACVARHALALDETEAKNDVPETGPDA